MNNEIKIGTKIKALVDRPNGGGVKKGEIGVVTRIATSTIYANFPSQSTYYCSTNLIGTKYEIIPEEIITNTFGLKIGDILPEKVIRAWANESNNYSYGNIWTKGIGMFEKDRRVKSFKIINCVLGFEVSDTATIYLKAEGFKEFMDNFDKPKIETQFEVGKWYRYDKIEKHYYKPSENSCLGNGSVKVSEDIFNGRYRNHNNSWSVTKDVKLLTDLSEIQPYLPDGHVDKINTIPEKETKKHTITDIPTTQPIVIKLNKKINYLIPKSI